MASAIFPSIPGAPELRVGLSKASRPQFLARAKFSWQAHSRAGLRFQDRLRGERADEGLRRERQAAVRSLESIQLKELMKLLGQVKGS